MIELDLHGFTHEDARRRIIHFVEDHWYYSGDLVFITGHSSKMKQIVIDVLCEYDIDYSIDLFDPQLPIITYRN